MNHYYVSLNKKAHESTVRKFKNAYLPESKRIDKTTLTLLTPTKRGRPTCIMLGELDADL